MLDFSIVSGRATVGVMIGVMEGVIAGVVPMLAKVTFLVSEGVGVVMLSVLSSWLAEIPILSIG